VYTDCTLIVENEWVLNAACNADCDVGCFDRAATMAPTGEQNMLLRRLKLYHFEVAILPPGCRVQPCPRCFAMLITAKAREFRGEVEA
jgi:hypothetical protein